MVPSALAALLYLTGCLESAQPLLTEANATTPLPTGFYEDCTLTATDEPYGCKQVHVFVDERKQYRAVHTNDESDQFMLGEGLAGADAVIQVRPNPIRTFYGIVQRRGDDWLAFIPKCKAMPAEARARLGATGRLRQDESLKDDCVFRTLEGVRTYLAEVAADIPAGGPLLADAEKHRLRRQTDNAKFVAAVRTDFADAVARGSWERAVAIAGLQARTSYNQSLRADVLAGLGRALPQIEAWTHSVPPDKRDTAMVTWAWAQWLSDRPTIDLSGLRGITDSSPAALSGTVMMLTVMATSGRDDVQACRMTEQVEVMAPSLPWPLDDWLRLAKRAAKCS